MTRRVFATNNPDEDEGMPCLFNSDITPDIVPSSLGDDSLSTEFTSCHSDDEQLLVRARRVVDRSNRPASASASQHRSRSRPRSAARQRSRSRPTSPARQRSRSRPRSSAPEAASHNARFSYSRLTSMGGTTVYRTPYMSQLDAFLQTTSGLRLETDGKCTFLFKGLRFVIEAGGGSTGDFLFYASFGPMKKLQHINRPKNLLRLMASWNEELKGRRGSARDQEEGQEHSGLLRIDSSMPDGPHVALIYYGRLDNIVNAAHFQDKLDDFVDDTLEYSHKIHGTKEKIDAQHHNRISRSSSPSSFPSSDESDNGRSKSNRDAKNRNTKTSTEPPIQQEKSATLAELATATTNDNSSKASIFSKVISSLHRPHMNLGYQEKDCYIVDSHAVEAGNVKPTIILSRVEGGGEKQEECSKIGEHHTVRKGSSFHDRGTASDYNRESSRSQKGRYFHVGDDDNICQGPRKGRSFHVADDDNFRQGSLTAHVEALPSGPAKPPRKSTSFMDDDYGGRNHHPRRGGSSFHVEENGVSHHDQTRKNGTPFDDGRNVTVARTAKSKSFHYSDSILSKNTDYTKIKSKLFHSSNDEQLNPEKINGRIQKRHSVQNERSTVEKGSGSHQNHRHASRHTSSLW